MVAALLPGHRVSASRVEFSRQLLHAAALRSPRQIASPNILSGISPKVVLAKPVAGADVARELMRPMRFARKVLFAVKFLSVLQKAYMGSLPDERARELIEARMKRRTRGKDAMRRVKGGGRMEDAEMRVGKVETRILPVWRFQ